MIVVGFQKIIKAHKYIFQTASFQKWSKRCSLLLNLWDFCTGMADEVCYQSHKALLILSQLWWSLTLNSTNLAIVVPEVVHLHILSNANYIFDLKKKRLFLSHQAPFPSLQIAETFSQGHFSAHTALLVGFLPFYFFLFFFNKKKHPYKISITIYGKGCYTVVLTLAFTEMKRRDRLMMKTFQGHHRYGIAFSLGQSVFQIA